jgi:hypothetical protein
MKDKEKKKRKNRSKKNKSKSSTSQKNIQKVIVNIGKDKDKNETQQVQQAQPSFLGSFGGATASTVSSSGQSNYAGPLGYAPPVSYAPTVTQPSPLENIGANLASTLPFLLLGSGGAMKAGIKRKAPAQLQPVEVKKGPTGILRGTARAPGLLQGGVANYGAMVRETAARKARMRLRTRNETDIIPTNQMTIMSGNRNRTIPTGPLQGISVPSGPVIVKATGATGITNEKKPVFGTQELKKDESRLYTVKGIKRGPFKNITISAKKPSTNLQNRKFGSIESPYAKRGTYRPASPSKPNNESYITPAKSKSNNEPLLSNNLSSTKTDSINLLPQLSNESLFPGINVSNLPKLNTPQNVSSLNYKPPSIGTSPNEKSIFSNDSDYNAFTSASALKDKNMKKVVDEIDEKIEQKANQIEKEATEEAAAYLQRKKQPKTVNFGNKTIYEDGKDPSLQDRATKPFLNATQAGDTPGFAINMNVGNYPTTPVSAKRSYSSVVSPMSPISFTPQQNLALTTPSAASSSVSKISPSPGTKIKNKQMELDERKETMSDQRYLELSNQNRDALAEIRKSSESINLRESIKQFVKKLNVEFEGKVTKKLTNTLVEPYLEGRKPRKPAGISDENYVILQQKIIEALGQFAQKFKPKLNPPRQANKPVNYAKQKLIRL